MASMTFINCPFCGHCLAEGCSLGRGPIGPPFVECPRCKKLVLDPGCTEWQLMDAGRRFIYFLYFAPATLFYAVGLPAVANFYFGVGWQSNLMYFVWIGGLILSFIFNMWRASREIKASNERIKDPKYRKVLEEFGLF
jgi:hypothetical protein